jgi:hypothetical protein
MHAGAPASVQGYDFQAFRGDLKAAGVNHNKRLPLEPASPSRNVRPPFRLAEQKDGRGLALYAARERFSSREDNLLSGHLLGPSYPSSRAGLPGGAGISPHAEFHVAAASQASWA